LKYRFKNSTELCADWKETSGVSVHPSVVRRRLITSGLKGCKARKKPLLTPLQRRKRLAWARAHRNWTLEQWRKVIFSDESTFTINSHAGNVHVRRREGEEFRPECILKTAKHPKSVMVWSCMSANGIGRLEIVKGMMNARKYVQMLQNKLVRSACDMFQENSWIFQDDNAPCHRAKVVKEWLQQAGIQHLDWPAQSPDLNPIENLWHRLGSQVAKEKPRTERELIEKIIRVWNHVITREELGKLVDSMPNRVRAVIHSRGHPTKY
jgi:hypothetical protein